VHAEAPLKVSVCELLKNPPAHNHKLVEVTSFMSWGFEDSTLFDPACPNHLPSVWAEYGGTAAAGTMYCCAAPADRKRPKTLKVDGIRIPLMIDSQFRELDRLLHLPSSRVVRATLVGRFFARKLKEQPSPLDWGGYGHFGLATLLAIQQVVSVAPETRTDLYYLGWPTMDSPDDPKCHWAESTGLAANPVELAESAIETQRTAEAGSGEWVFQDSSRVAREALGALLNVDPASIEPLQQAQGSANSLTYEWQSYVVLVGHPYALTFYAKDPAKLVWVAVAVFEKRCSS